MTAPTTPLTADLVRTLDAYWRAANDLSVRHDGAAHSRSLGHGSDGKAPNERQPFETLTAVELLRTDCPDLKVRVINVVDLMKLQPQSERPHGLSDKEFDGLFTTDKPIIFAYHGYPRLIHRLTYRRTNHRNLHVRGYKEEGTTTTPFDTVVAGSRRRRA
jgi:XFP C-terminal domain